MRKSLLLLAAILISMTASAQKKSFKYFKDFKPKMFAMLDASNSKSYKVNGAAKFKASSVKEDAEGNPSAYYMRPSGGFYQGLSTNKYYSISSLCLPANTDLTLQAVFDPADGDLDFEWVYALSADYNEETEKVDTVWSEPIEGTFIASEPDLDGEYNYNNRGELENGSITISNGMSIYYPAPMLTAYGGDPRNPTEGTYFAGDDDGLFFGFGSQDIVDYGILSYVYSAELQSFIDQWNAEMHFVNYDPGLLKSFYDLSNYFATNSEEANNNLNGLYEFDALTIKGMAEYFTASDTPYYLTGIRGEICSAEEIEADDIEIYIVNAQTGEPMAVAPISSMYVDSWDGYFFTAPITPMLIENDFFVIITPAEGSSAQISPMLPTTVSMENAYDDGTVFLLADLTEGGIDYTDELLDLSGLSLGAHNYVQASMIGIMTTYEEPDVSGINSISTVRKADNSIYNMSGVKVSNGSRKGLATGVYVQNGKKIVIK